MSRRLGVWRAAVLAMVGLLVAAPAATAAAASLPSPASARITASVGGVPGPEVEVIQGRVLRLVSMADWDDAASLLPGRPVRWDVAVSAETAEPGTITLGVSAIGDAPLLVDAELCPTAWRAGACPGGAETLRSRWSIPRDGAQISLARFSATEDAHLRLRVALAEDAGGVTRMRVHAHGVGDSVSVAPETPALGAPSPAGALPTTGGSTAPIVVFVGIVLAALGVVLSRRRGKRDVEVRWRVE
ncbi:LPXTG cell wall anchor domain-containing protein [Microbacterium sp. 179-I 3D4 NHS]|uniref:LPXTG cell wall anchor domain-containing protein n=1 Tax=Microbacterium sp. 179-I 3D4 NHS TaxID=3142381 RepID=UPI0039A29266